MIEGPGFTSLEGWLADGLIIAGINPMDPVAGKTVLVVWQMVETLHDRMVHGGYMTRPEADDRISDLSAVAAGAVALLDHALAATSPD